MTQIEKATRFIERKINVAIGLLARSERAHANPRNYYSPDRVLRIRRLKNFLNYAYLDLELARRGEVPDINESIYDLRDI